MIKAILKIAERKTQLTGRSEATNSSEQTRRSNKPKMLAASPVGFEMITAIRARLMLHERIRPATLDLPLRLRTIETRTKTKTIDIIGRIA